MRIKGGLAYRQQITPPGFNLTLHASFGDYIQPHSSRLCFFSSGIEIFEFRSK